MIIQMKKKTNIIQTSHYIPDHPYRILIVENCGSGTTNVSLNLINS